MAIQPRCEDCRFFEKNRTKVTIGNCHRFPPMLVNATGKETAEELFRKSCFPVVGLADYCGEYQSK